MALLGALRLAVPTQDTHFREPSAPALQADGWVRWPKIQASWPSVYQNAFPLDQTGRRQFIQLVLARNGIVFADGNDSEQIIL